MKTKTISFKEYSEAITVNNDTNLDTTFDLAWVKSADKELRLKKMKLVGLRVLCIATILAEIKVVILLSNKLQMPIPENIESVGFIDFLKILWS